jgi:hypothetical protein
MRFLDLLSDQFLTWSANGRYSVVHFTQTPRAIAQANAGIGDALAGLAYRALQALRQTWLQVRRRSRPWPQVLPVGEFPGAPAANGLRAASRLRRRHRTPGELSPRPRDHRGDLRDQPRTIAPPRGALRGAGEPVVAVTHPHHRSANGRRTHRQHARGLAHRRARAGADRGGLR